LPAPKDGGFKLAFAFMFQRSRSPTHLEAAGVKRVD
jgi:hypothetical protein